MSSRGAKLRLVTFLTFVRFPLVLLFFAGAVVHAIHPAAWLFVLVFTALIAAAVTDLFDGYLARKLEVETDFGAHADPLMDKIFTLTTLPLLVFVATLRGPTPHGIFLLVLTVVFLARDQWVTFLRSIGSMYNGNGGTDWSGKLRACINFPLICAAYHFEESPHQFVNATFLYFFEGVALLINIVSVYICSRRYWPYLRRSANPGPADKSGRCEDAVHRESP